MPGPQRRASEDSNFALLRQLSVNSSRRQLRCEAEARASHASREQVQFCLFGLLCSTCLVPESRDAILSREAEDVLWQEVFMAAPERRRRLNLRNGAENPSSMRVEIKRSDHDRNGEKPVETTLMSPFAPLTPTRLFNGIITLCFYCAIAHSTTPNAVAHTVK